MRVNELIAKLQTLRQDASIKIVVPIEGRPYGGILKEVDGISETFDQDSNEMFYTVHLSDVVKS